MLTLALGLLFTLQLPAQEAPPRDRAGQVEEHVTVERVVLTGRVIDRYANPIRELGIHDFRLRIDGQEMPIESVDWNPAPASTEQKPTLPGAAPPIVVPESPSGRQLIVMLFQWELAGQKDTGFVRMMRQAMQFVDASAGESRFAVLAFGSSLHLLQDFTADRAAIRRAIEAVRNPRYSGTPGDGAASVQEIDRCRADSIERAFVCIGNQLQPISGPKSVLFFGWTVSSYRSSWRTRYPEMIDAVQKSEVSVFCLDISNGSHRLGDGLRQLSLDTGGLYQETFDFPVLARERVRTTLEGSYELVFRDLSSHRGWHRVEVEVLVGKATVLFPGWYRN